NRPALRRDQPAADPLACALEQHTSPASALPSDAIPLPRAVGVRCQLDARAAAGQGRPGPILLELSRAVPGSHQSDEVGNGGARGHHGISVPTERLVAAPWVALVPGVPPFGGVAPRPGRRRSVRVQASVVSPRALTSVRAIIGGWSVA